MQRNYKSSVDMFFKHPNHSNMDSTNNMSFGGGAISLTDQ